MPCSSIDFNDLRLVAPEVIDLEPDYFNRAVHVSDQVLGESCQWQTYLNALGLQGFIQWIAEQESSIVVNQENCSLLQPEYAGAIAAVCNLRIGGFKLCLLAAENLLNETISIPAAAIDLPEFSAHFYIVTEVQEEQKQVVVRGYGRYDQLVSYRHLINLSADKRWNYTFPLFLFDTEPNHLLFNVRLLDPTAMTLSGVHPKSPLPTITQIDLNTILSQPHSSQQCLWQLLPWAKGASLLQRPELLRMLHQWQQSPEKPTSLRIHITEIFTLLTQQAINTAQWLSAEFDELSQSLGWFSNQVLAAAPEFRSADRFKVAIDELRYQGMEMPSELRPMFQTVECDGDLLQLCAATWAPVTPAPSPHWTLLLILRNQMGDSLPDGLKLRVADLTGTLSEEEEALDTEFVYVRVNATQNTKLVATIVSPTGQILPAESYSFDTTAIAIE
ncbi:Protein of unknown function (DUF1822) [Leptolyngbya sp. PCC 7375]|nr:Protein of unknown function (DUF1822) [Leptolyngbya sp. PCC 7375]